MEPPQDVSGHASDSAPTPTSPPSPPHSALSPEEREREIAWRRSEALHGEKERGETTARHELAARSTVAAHAFAALAENVRDYAIFLMNPEGIVTFWGEGARLIKWWTKEQVEGRHLRLLYPPNGSDDGTAEAHLMEAAERGEYTGEGERMRSDGSTFWAGITLTALRGDDGTLLGFAKVTRDLTARRAADAMLEAAVDAAESARRAAEDVSLAKSNFLATISHEIRTPVNAILGYHELLDLEIEGPLSDGQRRQLARASASSRHLLTLISEVLDFSRLEAGRFVSSPMPLRIGDVVHTALQLVSPQAQTRRVELSDAVSGQASDLAVWGDELHVRQILVNLLSNAVKFTEPRGGEAGRITISVGTAAKPSPDAQLTGPGPWVYVRVEDTGIGIARDRLGAMFEPFVQGDMGLTRAAGGTGLGLAISRRLARVMQGDVTARSEMGVGSAFFLWMPAAPVASMRNEADTYQQSGAAHATAEHRAALESRGGAMPEGTLRLVAATVLAELERLLHAYVARLRSDPLTRHAHDLDEAALEDHMASFLGDLASTLTNLESAASTTGEVMRDSTAIQRVVATRHGSQRARLGWDEREVRREFQILNEELDAAVRRGEGRQAASGTGPERRAEIDQAVDVLHYLLEMAERISLESFRATEAGRAKVSRSDEGNPGQ